MFSSLKPTAAFRRLGRVSLLAAVGGTAMAIAACDGVEPAQETEETATTTSAPEATATSQPAPAATTSATPTSSAAQEPAGNGPSGTLTVAVGSVGAPSGLPRDSTQGELIFRATGGDTLLFSTLDEQGDLVASPGLADEWEMAPDLTYTDFKLHRGVQFHGGWGEMTAEDVAWTYNQANPEVTEGSTHHMGAEISTDVEGPVEVVDEYTVRFHWKGFGVPTFHKTVTSYRESTGIHPKRAFDEMGEDWMRDNFISTGPFEVEEWSEFNRIAGRAVEDHWRQVPDVQSIRYLEIPEAQTRRAMLETGEAQSASVAVADIPTLLEAGYELHSEGTRVSDGIPMGGNYWVKNHPASDAPLERPDYSDLPWVGDPDDPDSMERARKVRWALALTIDREGFIDAFFGGDGEPSYIGGVSIDDPLIQEKIDEYRIPYDPDQAKQLLKEAGWEQGFEIGFFTSDEEGSIGYEIVQAFGADWKSHLNVDVQVNSQPYAVYRPNFVNRTVQWLHFRAGGTFAPATWSEEWYIGSSVSSSDGSAGGGFNSGVEFPLADETLAKKAAATSLDEVKQATRDYLDGLHHQALWPNTWERVTKGVYDPNVIAEWKMLPMGAGGGWGSYPEYVVLKR